MSEERPNETTGEFEKRSEVDAITVAFLLVKADLTQLKARTTGLFVLQAFRADEWHNSPTLKPISSKVRNRPCALSHGLNT